MFPVAAQELSLNSLLSSIEKFHGKFYTKNRYRMNSEEMTTISLFRVKFILEFTSLGMNFLQPHEF